MKRLLESLEGALLGVSAALLAIMAVVVNVQVLFRYVIRRPLTWATELSTLMLVMAVFLAAAVALRRGGFAAVSILIDHLPARWRATVETIGNLGVFAFLTAGMVATSPLIAQAGMTATVTPALGVRMDWVYLALQVSFGLQAVYALVVAVRSAARLVRPESSPSGEAKRGSEG